LRVVFFAESAARFLAAAVKGLVGLRVDGFAVARPGDLAGARVGVLAVARLGDFTVVRATGFAGVLRVDVVRDFTGVLGVLTAGLTGVRAAALRAGESGKGGSPRTWRLALLCCSSVRRNSWRPSGRATK
jgi:hypothetical protein